MNNVILSEKHPEFAQRLRALGYHTIPTDHIDAYIPYESDHADMQCLIINRTAFISDHCDTLINALQSAYTVALCKSDITGRYPASVALNAAVIGKNVICRADALDPSIRTYCELNGYRINHVRQGYAKCSCAVVGDNALITADHGIYRSLSSCSISALLIEEGRVALDGADYGFIGGASGYDADKNTLYFSGSIDLHPDGARIKEFCCRYGVKAISLTDGPLTDIGGMIFC